MGIGNQRARESWLEQTLHSIPKNSRILDAGAGTQRYRRFCKHLNYVSQDFGEYDGQGDHAGLQTNEFEYGELDIISDITSIPEPEASFDAIMCVEVLEHVPDPALTLAEFARLLRGGGTLILTAPFCSLTHMAPYHFSTGFNKYWYEKHLTENGFMIDEMTANGNFWEWIAQEIYRIPHIFRRYSKSYLHPFDYLSMFVFLRMLKRFSKKDNNSSELLCYGYHIRAQKLL